MSPGVSHEAGGEPACGFILRRATERDADEVVSVLHRAFHEFQSRYTEQAFEATVLSRETFLRRLAEGPIWVGIRGKECLATAAAVITAKGLYVRGMATLPEARGLGMGWQLLVEIERFARSQSLTRMYLSTTPFLDRAIRLYENFGFRRMSEGPHDLFGTPLFTREKNLEPAAEDRSANRLESPD